jgi:transposase-like protein
MSVKGAVSTALTVQRCTVYKHRNLLAHAPERLHEEIGADYTDMIYAATPEDIAARRKAFIRKCRSSTAPLPTAWREQVIACWLFQHDLNLSLSQCK